jgi:hypothetical protein
MQPAPALETRVFSSSVKVKIDKALYERLAAAAARAGYATTDEFIAHVLERAAHASADPTTDAEVEKQLRGLGYIE